MNFLPDDYESPKTNSSYMKLQDGENKFRILSKPILGWEDWQDKTVYRYEMANKPAKPFDPKKPIRHFWSFIVWNYNEEKIQILHLVQATIYKEIEALCRDKDWGAPFFYDIKITKKGKLQETEYIVNPVPHKPLAEEIKMAFFNRPCDLRLMFENRDPFSPEGKNYTPGIFSREDNGETVRKETPVEKINQVEFEEINKLLNECDPNYRIQVSESLLKLYNCASFRDIPSVLYDKIKVAAAKKREEYRPIFEQLKFEQNVQSQQELPF